MMMMMKFCRIIIYNKWKIIFVTNVNKVMIYYCYNQCQITTKKQNIFFQRNLVTNDDDDSELIEFIEQENSDKYNA